jgi:hypothetical protein
MYREKYILSRWLREKIGMDEIFFEREGFRQIDTFSESRITKHFGFTKNSKATSLLRSA